MEGFQEILLLTVQYTAFRSRDSFSALDSLAPAAHLKGHQGSTDNKRIMGTRQEIQWLSQHLPDFHLNYQATQGFNTP